MNIVTTITTQSANSASQNVTLTINGSTLWYSFPPGKKGRVYRMVLFATKERPLHPLDLDRRTYGLDPFRYLRHPNFARDAIDYGVRLCKEDRKGDGCVYTVYWVEAIEE